MAQGRYGDAVTLFQYAQDLYQQQGHGTWETWARQQGQQARSLAQQG
ncbi:hypothetical protein [Prochlorothrix hollandica]